MLSHARDNFNAGGSFGNDICRQVELKDLMESLADKEQKIKLRERDLNVLIKKNLSLKYGTSDVSILILVIPPFL